MNLYIAKLGPEARSTEIKWKLFIYFSEHWIKAVESHVSY